MLGSLAGLPGPVVRASEIINSWKPVGKQYISIPAPTDALFRNEPGGGVNLDMNTLTDRL
jgi:hypothetical protein